MMRDPSAPPGVPVGPVRYGPGLAVLVVGTGTEPFTSAPAPVRLNGAAVPLVLVDSGSPVVPAAGASTVVRIGEDVGRGAAVNRALVVLPRDIGLIAVAPPGLVWIDGALGALHAAAARYPRAGILAPRVCDTGGAAIPSAHPLPRPRVVRGRARLPQDGVGPSIEGPVGWSSAPALLLRRAALDSVDGFDPRYPGRLDDLDLADRLARAGWLTVHVPSATVVHTAVERPDPAATRRYLADRTRPPVRALLRAAVRS
jgi:N-acetylglucosaminyl-diphospho-decaprenol L-rhamnosyltransferase